ncbi:MAG TPA: DNA polymerase I [Terriglobia bacterium]|nr:DNA polymerase I [Terriglobia bacterium]
MARSQAPEKLFLVDALSLVFRSFFAPMQAALVSPSGLPTKATYIFVRTLRKLLKDYHPEHVAVAFDLSAPTFRDKLFETYKANRPEFPEDLTLQLPYVRRFCAAMGLPIVEREGFEADDIMGTLAKQGKAQGFEVLLVSVDEDLFQLVEDGVKVLKPSRGADQPEVLCDTAKVEEIIGVKPEQVVDWLGLTGDPSDNIPGARPLPGKEPPPAPGAKKRSYIGPKGATELIRRFQTLDTVLANYEKVGRQSYREALRDFRAEALLSRELATIRTDVPLDVKATELRAREPDVGELVALCRELGFASLMREFLEEAPEPAASAGPEYQELRTTEAVEGWTKALDQQAPLAMAFGVEGNEGFSGTLTALAITDGARRGLIPLAGNPELLQAARVLLEDQGRPKSVHNSKLLTLLLRKAGVDLAGVTHDTLLYAYVLEPLASSHALSEVALRRLGRKVSGAPGEAAEITRELAGLLLPEVVQQGLKPLYDQIELPLSGVLVEVETAGVLIDPGILAEMSREFERNLTDLTREIYDLAGGSFDIDSPKQLGEVLFEKLRLPGGKKLKKSGQYSTVATVLEELAERHELPRKILEYRTRAKLKSTYIDALPRYIDPNTSRLHSSFNQAGSRTGRLSSSNPNLQNVPIGDEFAMVIRSAFVADPGSMLISADYSQIELRVLAHLSGDPVLIEAFQRDEDIHARTAQEIFGVPPALQTHEHRRMAKAINYGVIYGLSAFGLAARTGTSRTEAQQYIDAYFKRYARVQEYIEGSVEGARQTGQVRTLFGRLRPIPDISSRDIAARNRAEREAMNTPLQGTAADLLKLAMVKTYARLRREERATRMILTVHDELVFEAPEPEIDAAREIVREEMEGVYPMKVPLKVDLGVGKNWQEAK